MAQQVTGSWGWGKAGGWVTFDHRLKCQGCAAHTKSRDDHGSSPQEPPSLVEEKRCTNTRDTSHLTCFTIPDLRQEAGEDGEGERGQRSDYVGLNTGRVRSLDFIPSTMERHWKILHKEMIWFDTRFLKMHPYLEERKKRFGINRYTGLYSKWITNKDLLYSTGNSVQYYVAAWMGGAFEGEWIHVYTWMSPFAVHLKLSQHC